MTDSKSVEQETIEKRKRIPSVLVDCRDCDSTFEVDARTFDLAIDVGDGTFLCDDCRGELADG